MQIINEIGYFKSIPISAILKLDGNDWSQGEFEGNAPSVPLWSS